ncbi:30S ribosomal protein S1 [Bacillus piscicola]|uniref:30S ribosomal protein S1 n=1 Tax=Bacillus piscicola TaxID=1632684 RepID=UPI001F092F68|nr:30S ribosomal protein S1 [Bacillus piscicola]
MSEETMLDIFVEGYQTNEPITEEEERQRALEKVYSARQNSTILQSEMIAIENHGQGENDTPCAVVRIGTVKGIIPMEQMEAKDYRQLRNMMGTSIDFKVIGIDRERDLFIGSRKAALEHMKGATFNRLEEAFRKAEEKGVESNVIVNAVVRFVNKNYMLLQIGGIETTMDVSEYDYDWINDLREKVKVEEKIPVKVLSFDRENERIEVSRKQTISDPWINVRKFYNERFEYSGTVSGVREFGNFIKLMPGINCLAPHMKFEALNAGDKVLVRIREIDEENQKITGRVIKVIQRAKK